VCTGHWLQAADAASTSSVPAAAGTTASPGNTCSVSYRGQQFSAPQGSKLRTAMLLNGVSPHNGKAQLINCRGLGTCGTCAVEIK
jgi:ferredoxin